MSEKSDFNWVCLGHWEKICLFYSTAVSLIEQGFNCPDMHSLQSHWAHIHGIKLDCQNKDEGKAAPGKVQYFGILFSCFIKVLINTFLFFTIYYKFTVINSLHLFSLLTAFHLVAPIVHNRFRIYYCGSTGKSYQQLITLVTQLSVFSSDINLWAVFHLLCFIIEEML